MHLPKIPATWAPRLCPTTQSGYYIIYSLHVGMHLPKNPATWAPRLCPTTQSGYYIISIAAMLGCTCLRILPRGLPDCVPPH